MIDQFDDYSGDSRCVDAFARGDCNVPNDVVVREELDLTWDPSAQRLINRDRGNFKKRMRRMGYLRRKTAMAAIGLDITEKDLT